MDWKALLSLRIVRIISAATIVGSGFFAQPYRPLVFVGESMMPTYTNRELALTTNTIGDLKKGDVVVMDGPQGTFVKRIAFLPGDWLEYIKAGSSWYLVDERILKNVKRPQNLVRKHVRVPEGYVFVLGDNAVSSVDSRQLGVLPISSIRSKLIAPKPLARIPSPIFR